jgi:hypothetical protein
VLTLVYDPVPQAEIWGVKTQEPLSEPPSTLFHLRADGTGFTEVGIILLEGIRVDVNGLEVDAQGRLIGYMAGRVSGQLVRNLIDNSLVAGDHDVVWDGRDRTGREAGSGVYFLRLETSEGIQTHKMALIR